MKTIGEYKAEIERLDGIIKQMREWREDESREHTNALNRKDSQMLAYKQTIAEFVAEMFRRSY